ncbi:MAG: AzlD domain-containing protein [Halothermotrichaceae bacterium]
MEVKYLVMIAGMTVVTFLPRFLPLAILTKRDIPDIVVQWLRFIPVAILAALLAPGILIQEGKLVVSYTNIYLLAALPSFLIAIYKKNIFLTIIVGVVSVMLLNFII